MPSNATDAMRAVDAERKRRVRIISDIKIATKQHHEALHTDAGVPIWFSDMMEMNQSTLEALILSAKRVKQLKKRLDQLISISDEDEHVAAMLLNNDIVPEIVQQAMIKKNIRSISMKKSYEARDDQRDENAPHDLDEPTMILADDMGTAATDIKNIDWI